LNKVWRQASLISAMIGQFGTTQGGADMLDDGSTSGQNALLTTFINAVKTTAIQAIGVGYLPITGGTLTGPLTINAAASQLSINAPAGNSADIVLARPATMSAFLQARTGTTARWQVVLADASPETGNNAGSNFDIQRFNDAGTYLDTPLSISRQTGVVNFTAAPTINGGNLPYLPISGGTLTGPLGVASPGISYAGTTGHWIGFGWDGSFIQGYVDGTYIGELANTGWVEAVAGAYLPLSGGTITGSLQVNQNFVNYGYAFHASTVYFNGAWDCYNNAWPGWRSRQWASNWWDGWNTSNGNRNWFTPAGSVMQLDYSGNLILNGVLQVNSGRIHSNSSIGVTDYGSGTSQGLWAAGDGLWFGWADGGANPTNGLMRLGNDGVLCVWNGFISYNWMECSSWASVGGALYVGGNATINGSEWVGGRIDVGGQRIVSHSGQPTVAVEAGLAMAIMTNVFIGGGMIIGQTDYYGNPAGYSAFANVNGTFAAGGFYSWSSRELKLNIRAAPQFDSLAAIRRLQAVAYEREDIVANDKDGKHLETFPGIRAQFGLIAEDVRQLLPDAVQTIGVPAISHDSLLVHLCRAVGQLADAIDGMRAAH